MTKRRAAAPSPVSPEPPRDLRRPILAVDDDDLSRELVSEVIGSIEGVRVVSAAGVDQALKVFDGEHCPVVVTDLRMPGKTGMDLLAAVLARDPYVQVIVVSGEGGIGDAVRAMKSGAQDYLVKPFGGEELRLAVERALRQHALISRQRSLELELDSHPYHTDLIGRSAPAEEIRRLIARAAAVESTIAVVGETGTGKELVARLIHRRSARVNEPFVAVNCGALPGELVESELFGHVRGSFTGAVADKVGKFEAAGGGTIFLDEVGELPLATQVKLLRVLESRFIERVGGTKPVSCRARVIAATHRDLRDDVRAGRFRQDLYYRLWVVPVLVPPLRERREDIPLLADFFIRQISRLPADTPPLLTTGAADLLQMPAWPGNVRELRNAVERAIFHGGGFPLDEGAFNFLITEQGAPKAGAAVPCLEIPLPSTVAATERLLVEAILKSCGADVRRTAELLGVSRSWVYERIKAYGLKG